MNKYDDIDKIWNKFSHLKDINKFINIDLYKDYKFLMIRAIEYDDIHKAIKYGVWTSTN